MSLIEVLPDVQMLSQLDKIRLIQYLARELERDANDLIEQSKSYPVWSPEGAHAAAATLLQALANENSLTFAFSVPDIFDVRSKP